jgi:hypothetical protein
MAYYQDCSYETIADGLGCSVTTVKTRLRHARSQLERQLAREDRAPASPQARAACYSAMPTVEVDCTASQYCVRDHHTH